MARRASIDDGFSSSSCGTVKKLSVVLAALSERLDMGSEQSEVVSLRFFSATHCVMSSPVTHSLMFISSVRSSETS